MKSTKIIAISSFPCIGNAGLKPMITILGGHLIPVPSLILTATTNIKGFVKTETDFIKLLEGSLELCKSLNYDVILFCGYIYKASQIEFISDMWVKYKSIIKMVIVDPILGDNNRLYVENEILIEMPKLLSIADIALPNLTEVKFLSTENKDINGQLEQLLRLYPSITLIVKGIQIKEGWIGLMVKSGNNTPFNYNHRKLIKDYGGTGDLFASYFIYNHIFKQKDIFSSVKKAAQLTIKSIRKSIKLNSPDLIINGIKL